MDKAELVLIPCHGAGHLVSAVEVAKLIVNRDKRLSITILIIKIPSDDGVVRYTQSLAESNLNESIKLIDLPDDIQDKEADPKSIFTTFIQNEKPHVREAVSNVKMQSRLVGLVRDMFCTSMMEVADEFGVPTYIFYPSSAAFLRLHFHFQSIHDEENVLTTELKEDSDTEFSVPSLVNPVPTRCLPSLMFYKDGRLSYTNQQGDLDEQRVLE